MKFIGDATTLLSNQSIKLHREVQDLSYAMKWNGFILICRRDVVQESEYYFIWQSIENLIKGNTKKGKLSCSTECKHMYLMIQRGCNIFEIELLDSSPCEQVVETLPFFHDQQTSIRKAISNRRNDDCLYEGIWK
jgi:hypothetical protein